MIDSTASAAAEIKRLALPSVFGAVMDGTLSQSQTAPDYLRRAFRRPDVYFEICHDLPPAVTEICPLWEHNGEAIIGRLPDGKFVRFYYEDAGLEDPVGAIEMLGRNYQEFVTSVLLELADAGLFDQYAQEVADFLEYKHLPALQDHLRAWNEEDGELRLAHFRDSLL